MCEDKSIWMHGGGLTALVTDLNTIWLNVIILIIIIIIIIILILMEMLVHAFITSRVDYCNSLLYGLPIYQLNKLQRVLNASARLVCNAPRFCHISPLFVVCIGFLLKPGYNLRYCLLRSKQFTALLLNIYAIY